MIIKKNIKKLIPKNILSLYHRGLALVSNFFYGQPSKKMVVVGVTGTNGKSTTVMLAAKILAAAGHQVGATSTAIFKIGDREWLNDKKMTMLGRFALQKFLRRMVKAGCGYAVVETSSEGIKQFRHLGLNYDVAVFTNLTPEHLESHGGFANYKKAKQKLFAKLIKEKNKEINGRLINKTIVVNGDDPHAIDFFKFAAARKYVFGLTFNQSKFKAATGEKVFFLKASDLDFRPDGIGFKLDNLRFNLRLFGRFNVYNALAAMAVARSQGGDLSICRSALEAVDYLPGRMEFINQGQNFKVLIDYAPEPESLKQLYQTIEDHRIILPGQKLIQVFGSCGGGRDRGRRPILGELAGRRADFIIVTNEDPYDDDPQVIIDEVAVGALQAGKIFNQNLFKILDRREAIKKALSLANHGDLVVLTGKGSEQAICLANGRKLPWDERRVVIELIKAG